jgi:hypothetical protein
MFQSVLRYAGNLLNRLDGLLKIYLIRSKLRAVANECGVTERGLLTLSVTPEGFPESAPIFLLAFDTGTGENALSLDERNEILTSIDYFRDQIVNQGLRHGFCSVIWYGDDDIVHVSHVVDNTWDKSSRVVMECSAWLPDIGARNQELFMTVIRTEFPFWWKILCG